MKQGVWFLPLGLFGPEIEFPVSIFTFTRSAGQTVKEEIWAQLHQTDFYVACVVAQKGFEAFGAEVVGSWDLSLGFGWFWTLASRDGSFEGQVGFCTSSDLWKAGRDTCSNWGGRNMWSEILILLRSCAPAWPLEESDHVACWTRPGVPPVRRCMSWRWCRWVRPSFVRPAWETSIILFVRGRCWTNCLAQPIEQRDHHLWAWRVGTIGWLHCLFANRRHYANDRIVIFIDNDAVGIDSQIFQQILGWECNANCSLLVWACAFFSKCCWQPVTWWQVRSWPETWDIDRNQRCAELTLSWRLPDVMWGRMQPDEIPSCENRVSVIVQWLCMRCKQTQTIRNTSWKDVSLC